MSGLWVAAQARNIAGRDDLSTMAIFCASTVLRGSRGRCDASLSPRSEAQELRVKLVREGVIALYLGRPADASVSARTRGSRCERGRGGRGVCIPRGLTQASRAHEAEVLFADELVQWEERVAEGTVAHPGGRGFVRDAGTDTTGPYGVAAAAGDLGALIGDKRAFLLRGCVRLHKGLEQVGNHSLGEFVMVGCAAVFAATEGVHHAALQYVPV
eukprot:3936946-Rhodomonas_salina.2